MLHRSALVFGSLTIGGLVLTAWVVAGPVTAPGTWVADQPLASAVVRTRDAGIAEEQSIHAWDAQSQRPGMSNGSWEILMVARSH